ncbi:MAG: dipeptide ABC transporter ATP-binding protein [Bdellovibrionaceae bacterium]|nr:dipeptide ABC transporter ATP-binding protein [Pseudobdellovibrionaceae bacterium]NUM60177.1 dipeptide ABC transporter ATP-binding protein [Pseudobdellovibrionaceae bacterium]
MSQNTDSANKNLSKELILKASNIKKFFPIKKGFFLKTVGQVKAVDDVSLEVRKGETLGLVGESGCGKSTLGRTLIRLYEPTSGEIEFEQKNFLKLSGGQLRQLRKDIQMIFQDPYASLDPRMTVGQILRQPFDIHNVGSSTERTARVKELLELVGLKASHVNRYPHEFSGGQRQRICIARAIALNPKLIICDEPVSALDVSIQAQILNLLKDLQEKLGLTYVFISHDLSVIEYFCDRVAVMYLGKIVEIGTREEIFNHPKHPYTQALLSAIPRVGEGKKQMKKSLSGEVPSPINPPSGCTFHPRCQFSKPECSQKTPTLVGSPKQMAACWLYDNELNLIKK